MLAVERLLSGKDLFLLEQIGRRNPQAHAELIVGVRSG
jgi:hypothetical protein